MDNSIPKITKPDHHIEQFWLTFKNSINSFLDEDGIYETNYVSNILNKLQKKEKYSMIETYISDHIERVGYRILYKDDFYRASHIDTNLKRWTKITTLYGFTGTNICETHGVFYNLLKIYLSIKNGKESDAKNKVVNLIKEYSVKRSNHILHKILDLSVDNRLEGVIVRIIKIVDLELYLGGRVDDGVKNQILGMRGRKLFGFIKSMKKKP
jgi:hypothetical protein